MTWASDRGGNGEVVANGADRWTVSGVALQQGLNVDHRHREGRGRQYADRHGLHHAEPLTNTDSTAPTV